MTDSEIIKKVEKTVRICNSSDPREICSAMNITVMSRDLGALKGMSMIIKRNAFIMLNENLRPSMRKAVMAHEIGHLILHRDLISDSALIRRHTMMRLDEQPEYEANLFAALLLIDRGELFDLLKSGYTVEDAAKILRTDKNFIMLILHAFAPNEKRSQMAELPRANFLR